MIVKIFSIYDSKAEAYNSPFYMQTQSLAIRAFTDEANNVDSQIGKHPADFTLFYMGEYDDHTASFNLEDTKISLGVASEFVGKE
jgi:lipoprotein signal peptidase